MEKKNNEQERIIDTNKGQFRIENNEQNLYAVSVSDDDFYYTFSRNATDEEIMEFINATIEDEKF